MIVQGIEGHFAVCNVAAEFILVRKTRNSCNKSLNSSKQKYMWRSDLWSSLKPSCCNIPAFLSWKVNRHLMVQTNSQDDLVVLFLCYHLWFSYSFYTTWQCYYIVVNLLNESDAFSQQAAFSLTTSLHYCQHAYSITSCELYCKHKMQLIIWRISTDFECDIISFNLFILPVHFL